MICTFSSVVCSFGLIPFGREFSNSSNMMLFWKDEMYWQKKILYFNVSQPVLGIILSCLAL